MAAHREGLFRTGKRKQPSLDENQLAEPDGVPAADYRHLFAHGVETPGLVRSAQFPLQLWPDHRPLDSPSLQSTLEVRNHRLLCQVEAVATKTFGTDRRLREHPSGLQARFLTFSAPF